MTDIRKLIATYGRDIPPLPAIRPADSATAPHPNTGFTAAAKAAITKFAAQVNVVASEIIIDARFLDDAALDEIRPSIPVGARLWTMKDWEAIGDAHYPPITKTTNYIAIVPVFDGPNLVIAADTAHAQVSRVVLNQQPRSAALLVFIPRFTEAIVSQECEQFMLPGSWSSVPSCPYTPHLGAFVFIEAYKPDFYHPLMVEAVPRNLLLSALFSSASSDV